MEREVFHAGEVAMQRAAGVDARLRAIGAQVIRDRMPEQHREFFGQLPMLFVGSVDDRQRPWASMLAGLPGFIETPDARHLRVSALPAAGDPLAARLRVGTQLGLLGIELPTRRRNRINGTVVALADGSFTVQVGQSFGNCPKYIQAREPRWVGPTEPTPPAHREGRVLSNEAADWVMQADTLYIASSAPGEGVDVSHRGGKPGFVRVERKAAGTVLTFPDFVGNFFFNTLGNITVHPHAGLLFIDHATGSTLQLTGRARIATGDTALEAFAGARRLVEVDVDEGWLAPAALPLRWTAPVPAPQLTATGQWSLQARDTVRIDPRSAKP